MAAKILCIEDEPELRETIAEELADVGYDTMQADNGRTGLAAIVEDHPDLVLCDINMPEMDGTQLLQNLRVNHPDLADMPFIFLTAQADRGSVLNGKKLGADDYLTKPIDFELLIATVEARLGQVRRMEAKREQQLVKLYRTVSGNGAETPDGGSASGDAPSAAPTIDPVSPEMRDKLAQLTSKNNGQITAGRLQFIGLDHIRQEFEDRWAALEERVFEIADKTIAKRIDTVDVYRRDENNNYVICFAQLDEAEASFKADRIANEIREKILGECGRDSGPPPLVGKGLQGAPKSDNQSYGAMASRALRSEVHSIPLSFEESQKTESVFDLVQARLDQAASVRRLANEATLKEVFESCRIRMSSVELRNGSLAPIRLVKFDEPTQLKIDGLVAGQRNITDLVAELCLVQLGQVAENVYTRAATAKFIDVVDIGIPTLESKRHQERLLELIQSFDDLVCGAIAFRLIGVPQDIYPAKLSGLVNLVRPFCRLVAIELGRPALDNIDPLELRAPIITGRFDKLVATPEKATAQIKTLVHEIHEKKARLLIDSIPDLDHKMQLCRMGIDLLSMS